MFGHSSLILAFFALSSVHGQTPDPPAPNGSVDIGDVGLAGSHSGSGSDWNVTGAGTDIWGHYDGFHYLYWNQTGDLTVTALINEFTCPDNCESWRKGGIMIRGDTGIRDPHSMIQLTGFGLAHQSRQNLNGHSLNYHDWYTTSKMWLRLVKSGTTITSFVKRDGEYGFMPFHTVEVNLPENFLVGLAVTSHDQAKLGTIDVSNFEISNTVSSLPNNFPTEVGETGTTVRVQQTKEDLWTLTAAGSGIGGTSDSFGFLDTVHSGDLAASLHFEKLVRRNNDSKGGLMIRASHAANSTHVSLLVKSGSGINMVWRETEAGETQSKNVGVWAEDMELKLEKTGNSVVCSYKHSSAPEWYVIGTATAELGNGDFYVGQAVSSADFADKIELVTGSVNVVPAAV